MLLDGRVVGRVTSGAYGHTLGAAVGFAYIQAAPNQLDQIIASGAAHVDVAGTLAPATLSLRPFYDPAGERLRGGPASG